MKKLHLFICAFLFIGILTTDAQYTNLLSFDGSTYGQNPYGNVIISGSVMYGMAAQAGGSMGGCIFSINTNGTGFTKLYSFNGTLGKYPHGSLILSSGILYGVTFTGGANSDGCIFSITTSGGSYTDLHDFNGTAGSAPQFVSLVLSGSTLYGTASTGGANSDGCIFSITTSGGSYTDLHDFNGTAGSTPYSSLLLSVTGDSLFGTASTGGANSDGVVFSITTSGSSYTDLHDFNGTAGETPHGSLILSGKTLYGMATDGGANSDGCIFSITVTGGSYTDLYDFTGTYGENPVGNLTLSGSVFFGMTHAGGANSDGNIFSVHTDGTEFSDLHDFNGTAGENPYGSLALSGGVLYGMTYGGGASGYGVIFSNTICDLAVSTDMITDVSCYGGNNGSASASPSGGGSPPYTYSWSPSSQTTQTATGLTAGTYTVTVTDFYGCTATASAYITQPSDLIVTATAKYSAVCPGSSDSLYSTVSGGTSPYNYSWTAPYGDVSCSTCQNTNSYPFGSPFTFTGAEIVDDHGCSSTASVSITVYPFPYVTVTGPMNPIAPGRADTLIASGFDATSYLWSTSATTSSIIVSPSVATTYTVKATNTYGCYDTARYNLDTERVGNGMSSSTAIPVTPHAACDPISYTTDDSVVWFSFVPADSTAQIIAFSNYLGLPVPHVHRLTLYNSSLGIVYDEHIPDMEGANQVDIDASSLDIGSTYYVRAARTPAHANMQGCNTNAESECNATQRWSFQICFRNLSIFVPLDSGSEPPATNQAYYECRGQIRDMNNIPRFDIKAYTNFASPAVYCSDSAVSFVYAHVDTGASFIDTVQRVDMVLTGSEVNPSQPLFKMQENTSAGYLNYFLGFVPNGVTNVDGYSRVVYKSVYPNVDMHVYSNTAGTKFYFVCNPDAINGAGNPADIKLEFKGATSVSVTGSGGLSVVTELGTLSFAPGYSYYDSAGIIKPTSWHASFETVNSNTVKFNTGTYNPKEQEPIIIEVDRGNLSPPSSTGNMNFSTYVGSSASGGYNNEQFNDCYDDYRGNYKMYAAGECDDAYFPVTNGVVETIYNGGFDAAIAELYEGSLEWATYYGGSGDDIAYGVEADNYGNVYVTGYTKSSDFPTYIPSGAYSQSFNSGGSTTNSDAFILVLNTTGVQVKWATWFGGSESEIGCHLALDGVLDGSDVNENLYVVGGYGAWETTPTIPTLSLAGAYNSTTGLGWIARFSIGELYGSGTTPFGQRMWATDLGGYNSEAADDCLFSCCVDASNNLWVAGRVTESVSWVTNSTTYSKPASDDWDGAVAKIDATTNNIDWATYYGGDGQDYVQSICTNGSNVYMTGYTTSPSPSHTIPLTNPGYAGDYYQPTNENTTVGNGNNAFIAGYSNSGVSLWSTYFGGAAETQGNGIAYDIDCENLYITGQVYGGHLPLPTVNPTGTYTYTSYPSTEYDGYIAGFNTNNFSYVWGTYFGGSSSGSETFPTAISTTDLPEGSVMIVGASSNIPVYAAFQSVNYGGGDAFVTAFNTEPICILTGINTTSNLDDGITVFPNPTANNITVQMELLQNEKVEFILYNIMGQMVYDNTISAEKGSLNHVINLSLLANGIYLLKVNEGNEFFTKKVVKQD